jgi:hypothetical protein
VCLPEASVSIGPAPRRALTSPSNTAACNRQGRVRSAGSRSQAAAARTTPGCARMFANRKGVSMEVVGSTRRLAGTSQRLDSTESWNG